MRMGNLSSLKAAAIVIGFSLFCIFNVIAVNKKPFVIPEIREWNGGEGSFNPGERFDICYEDDRLEEVANRFAGDYAKMFGIVPSVTKGRPSKGSVSLSVAKKLKNGDEAYRLIIGKDGIRIEAASPKGAFWATRTLLQLSEQTDSHALPCGTAFDYPDYSERGFMIDVGRKFFPMSYLRDLVEVLSYYKMNLLQVHLNDNGFIRFYDGDWNRVPAGFRLESEMHPDLTSRDGYYSKKEWRDLQKFGMSGFVDVVPELDVPAHSLSIARVRPDLASDSLGRDNLNINNPATALFLDSLFREYLEGPDPVFVGKRVHIGTDEFGGYTASFRTSPTRQVTIEKFRALTDDLLGLVQSYGKEPMLWGSLTFAKGATPVRSAGVIMNIWNNGYADPRAMKDQGFRLMSIPDGYVYIVPMAGYYRDYLDIEKLYDEWTPAQIGKVKFEEKDPAIVGGMFAVWNDMIGNGVTVDDVHHRIFPALQTIAVKTWDGMNATVPFSEFDEMRQRLSEAPGVNLLGRWDSDNGNVFSEENVPAGSERTISHVGYGYTVEFDLESNNEALGTVLFSNGDTKFYLSDPISGMLGFSRDGYLERFSYAPRPGETRHIRIEGDNKETALYVDGKLIENLGIYNREYKDGKYKMPIIRTLAFPLHKAGDFKSIVKNLKVYNYRLSEK